MPTQTFFGLNSSICFLINSIFEPQESAIILKSSFSFEITSNACVPIEPVEPKIVMLRFIILSIEQKFFLC